MKNEDSSYAKTNKAGVPLSTRVSPKHRTKLDQMRQAGLKITIIIEQGIDVLYERLVQAGIVAESSQPADSNKHNQQ